MASTQETPSISAPLSCPALNAVYSPGADEKVRQAKILVVGAGGVGCELIKNLAAVGFISITVIDLDTVDFSNLNRQFLFRRKHVGKPKATEAASAIAQTYPATNIEGIMANIKEARFSAQYFQSFTLVCNALDNLEARRHVNRMCLAAKVPLVESGSTGYNGQCAVIAPGYECYDCTERPAQKTYAVCTIRSTPDKPVHCVVWAKFLFELVFGAPDSDNLLRDLDDEGSPAEGATNAIDTTEADVNAVERNNAGGVSVIDCASGIEGMNGTHSVKNISASNVTSARNAMSSANGIYNASSVGWMNGANGASDPSGANGANGTSEANGVGGVDIADRMNGSNSPNSAVATMGLLSKIDSVDGTDEGIDTGTAKTNGTCANTEQDKIAEPKSCINPDAQLGIKPNVASTDAAPHNKKDAKRVRFLDGDTPESFAKRVCDRVFVDDIETQRGMTDLWRNRAMPTVLDVDKVANAEEPVDVKKVHLQAQEAWSADYSARVFYSTLMHIVKHRHSDIGALTFDKDDSDAVLFVASASNLRANAYGVPLQSPFVLKGIAGNIVHAIATTNAVVGGLIVLEALKVVTSDGDFSNNQNTFVTPLPSGSRVKKLICAEKMLPPNRNCFVCSNGQMHLSVDLDYMTLQSLVAGVLQKKMSISQPSVHVSTGDYHNTVYESGSGLDDEDIELYESNSKKTLRSLKVDQGSQLVVEDFLQNMRCTLHVRHEAGLLEGKASEERYLLQGHVPKEEKTATDEKNNETEDVDDDCEVVPLSTETPVWDERETKRTVEVAGVDTTPPSVKKRERETALVTLSAIEPSSKKTKSQNSHCS